ncbi:exo-alpha-sialidase [Flavihumibacter stibioxidans]|nr:sialidase family protein [Flavihumibacter stibioxidans]
MKFNILICALIISLSSFDCSRKSQAQSPSNSIGADSYAPEQPVLRGLSINPFLRVIVSVQAGTSPQQIRKMHCTLNAASLPDIQKVEVYRSANESFSNTSLLASVIPSGTSFDIPVTLDLQPGMHFFWLNVVLKNDASIDNRIELRCTSLVDAGNKETAVKQDNSVYEKRTGAVIRKAGDDGVNTYRIPGIVQTDRGTLISVYDIRYKNSGDLPGNIDVGLSRSTDNGQTWEPMKVIMDMGAPHENNGVGDPSVLFDPVTKKLWVAALWSKGNRSIAGSLPGLSPDTTGQFVLVSSEDDGLTWSAPYTITPQVKNPGWHLFFNGPGNGIAMQDGKLVFAAQYWDEKKMPYSTIIYSDDKGASWKGKINGPKSNTTESQVVETLPGTLMLNMRDNRGGFRSVATTSDMGTNWSEHQTSYKALPDPVCMGSIIKAKVNVKGTMKDVLFFSNPNTSSGRYNITVKASLDMGETWLPANQLLVDERQCYGYSSLVKLDDHTIGILYEGTRDLYFVKLAVGEIIK